MPDGVAERMKLWSRRLPNAKSINNDYHGFESYSYSVMLLGLNYEPPASLPVLDFLDNRNALEMFRKIKQRTAHLVATLPSQYEYLSHVRAMKGRSSDEVLYSRMPMSYDRSLPVAEMVAAGVSAPTKTPFSKTRHWSAISITVSRSWVVVTMVLPVAPQATRKSSTVRWLVGSRAAVGSSSNKTSGS